MQMKAHLEKNLMHALGTNQLTRIEGRSTMKRTRLWVWVLPLLTVFLLHPYQVTAQTFPKVTWSNNEITIPGNGSRQFIDTPLTSNPLAAGWHTCIVTFSTELATSQGYQLAVLEYARGTTPNPTACQAYQGPIITQVNGGIDEAHTFVSPFQFYVHEANAPYTFHIRPCMSSGVGGNCRLRRHSMTLQCE